MSFIFKFKSNNGVYTLFNGAYSFVIETSKYAIVDCAKLTDTDLLTLAQHVFIGEVITTNLINFYSYTQLKLLGQVISDITVEDVLTSNSVLNALSANQGRILKNSVDALPTVENSLTSDSSINAASVHQVKIVSDAIALKLDASSYNDYNKGVYATFGALTTAHPTATSGSYALVDAGVGVDADFYYFDPTDGWLTGGGATLSNTDALLEGATNKYFTEARVRSTLLNGLSTATNDAVSSSDSVLGGMGKLQAQINVLLLPTVNTYSATTEYTLQAVDNDGRTYLRMNNGSANTVTVPSTQTKPISIRQVGAGPTTLEEGAGVTLNGTLAFTAQHQTKTLVPVSAGVFDIVG